MEPTLAIGQRVLVNRIGMDFSEPHVGEIAVFHPPEGAEQEECGPTPHVIKLGGAACAAPVPKKSSVNFIKRIVAGPGDEIYIQRRPRLSQGGRHEPVRRREGLLHPRMRREPGVQLPHPDQDSGRSLVHDGRQPWRIRRQQVLGTCPHGMDHRAGHRHLLAPRSDRDLLAPSVVRAEGGSCQLRLLGTRAASRPPGWQWQAPVRVRPPPGLSPRSRCGRGRTRLPRRAAGRRRRAVRLRDAHHARAALARGAERLQAAHRRGTRGALSAGSAQRRQGGRRVPVRARDRRARPAQDEPGRPA